MYKRHVRLGIGNQVYVVGDLDSLVMRCCSRCARTWECIFCLLWIRPRCYWRVRDMDQLDTANPRRKRPAWRKLRHWYLNHLSWPIPLWRIKRSVPVTLGTFPFRLAVVSETCSWANVVRRNRWETECVSYLQDSLHPGDQFVDIGAWIGPYSLLSLIHI